MAETQTTTPTPTQVATDPAVLRALKRKKRAAGRKKRQAKLRTDKEFAKTYFEARSKRAADKKSAFRKKKSRKK